MDAQSLIKELGPVIRLPDLALDENNVCRVEFDDMPVDFEALPDGSILYIYAQVIPVPMIGREKLFSRVLIGNLFGGETLGATLGYDVNQEAIILHVALTVEKTNYSDFQSTLERFLDRLKYWREECQHLLNTDDTNHTEVIDYKDGLRV